MIRPERFRQGVFVDTNLLLPWVVGREDVRMIARHKRTRTFSIDDYRLFARTILQLGSPELLVTPNTLSELSNLLAQHGEPERGRLFAGLQSMIHESREVVVASSTAADNPAFGRLGLTDAALLEAITVERPLLTTDIQLYLEAHRKAPGAAFNFNHWR